MKKRLRPLAIFTTALFLRFNQVLGVVLMVGALTLSSIPWVVLCLARRQDPIPSLLMSVQTIINRTAMFKHSIAHQWHARGMDKEWIDEVMAWL